MSPLFGGGDKHEEDESGVEAEVSRLRSLPLDQLAAEVLTRGFTVGDAGDHGRISVLDLAKLLVPGFLRLPQEEVWEVEELIGEGVQLLEHARLVQCTVAGIDRHLQWVLTRSGRGALVDGSAAGVLAKLG
jgi:hypothetical protein